MSTTQILSDAIKFMNSSNINVKMTATDSVLTFANNSNSTVTIGGLSNPSSNNHCANKAYVDSTAVKNNISTYVVGDQDLTLNSSVQDLTILELDYPFSQKVYSISARLCVKLKNSSNTNLETVSFDYKVWNNAGSSHSTQYNSGNYNVDFDLSDPITFTDEDSITYKQFMGTATIIDFHPIHSTRIVIMKPDSEDLDILSDSSILLDCILTNKSDKTEYSD